MAAWQDIFWSSDDGLRLHARDYPGDDAALPVVCLPGLTRNARDYDALARRIAGERRVYALDLRGRGESAHARDPMSYVPTTYARDVAAFLSEHRIHRFIAIGTALGGIVTMLLADLVPGRIAGALLNDVGPEIEPAGLARIRGYVGRSSTWPMISRNSRASEPRRVKDWTTITLDSASCALPARRVCSASSLVISAPPTMSECPPMYLVEEWLTMSAPRSSGFWR